MRRDSGTPDLPGFSSRGMRFFVAATAALVLGACVPSGLPETVLPAQIDYLCRDGSMLRVTRSPDGMFATVAAKGLSARLQRADSAAQEKYSDGPTTLYLEGDRALLTSDSFVVSGACLSTVPLPVARPMEPRS